MWSAVRNGLDKSKRFYQRQVHTRQLHACAADDKTPTPAEPSHHSTQIRHFQSPRFGVLAFPN